MGFFQNDIKIVEKPKYNKTNDVKMQSLSGYDAISEKLDENNTLTVKQPVVVNEQTKKQKSVLN